MSSFKNNRVVLAVFAVLMAFGLMAAYIPMIFPPAAAPEQTGTYEDDYGAQLPADNNMATTTPTSTQTKASLPDSFSGLQDEQNSLNDLDNLLK